jgi:uncharacterized damage-inducible protein DinB
MAGMNQALIAELEQEGAATRRVLERVPADHLEWRPHPKSMTLGQLAIHVATIPGGLARLCAADGFDAATADFTPPQPQDTAGLLPALAESLAAARDFLGGLDETAAAAPWRLTLGERELSSAPRVVMVRTLLFNHWYHHRGQLTVYLRLLDVPVPAVYGNSADENPFADAAA